MQTRIVDVKYDINKMEHFNFFNNYNHKCYESENFIAKNNERYAFLYFLLSNIWS